MSVGEIGLKSRRPSTPGANTNILYNKGGVDGADGNLRWDTGNSSLNVVGSINVTAGYLVVRGALPASGVENSQPGGTFLGAQALGNLQCIELFTANSTVDNAWWEIQAQNTGQIVFRTANDTYGNIVNWMVVKRANANTNIGQIILGNSADTPNINLIGVVGVTASLNSNGEIVTNTYLSARGNFPGIAFINAAPGGLFIGGQNLGNSKGIEIFTANAAVDNAWWEILATNTGALKFQTANDTYGNLANWMIVTRANANSNIGTISIGNPNDKPNTTVYGDMFTANISPSNLIATFNISCANLQAVYNIVADNIQAVHNFLTANITAVQNVAVGNLSLTGSVLNQLVAKFSFPTISWFSTTAAANMGRWASQVLDANGTWYLAAVYNDQSNVNYALAASRSANSNIANIVIGNPLDFPQVTIYGALNTSPTMNPIIYNYCGGV